MLILAPINQHVTATTLNSRIQNVHKPSGGYVHLLYPVCAGLETDCGQTPGGAAYKASMNMIRLDVPTVSLVFAVNSAFVLLGLLQ